MKVDKLAEDYRISTANKMQIEKTAFEAGYRAKETEIQELIDRLEKSKGKDFESIVVNPFEGVIKALKSLL